MEQSKIDLPKADKPDYHIDKAYRDICLTRIIGKLQKRVVDTKQKGWMEVE